MGRVVLLKGWFCRIMRVFVGSLIGVVLRFVIMWMLLWWNVIVLGLVFF